MMRRNFESLYSGRGDFERGASLLKEAIENDRISFSSRINADSLLHVRMLPNGRLNLDTIDELVRSCFLMLASGQLDNFYEAKK